MKEKPHRSAFDSPHWKWLKGMAWGRSQGLCEKCGTVLRRGSAHLHHLTYRNGDQETPKDVQLICLECHGKEHPWATFRPVSEQRKIAKQRRLQREKPKKKHAKRSVRLDDAWMDINGKHLQALLERNPYLRREVAYAAKRKERRKARP